ncbi:MAG: biotin/lipoyl-containing protein, partial [Defluviicoccus sp.]
MAEPIVMPSFGMYTAEGVLVGWLQPSGARVTAGDPILEIETEKATQEVVAPADGILHQVAPIGERLSEQALVGFILAEGEAPPVVATEPVAEARRPVSP